MTHSKFKSLVEKNALTTFFILTFLISWIGWGFQLAYALRWTSFHSLGFSILAGLGPAIAAIVVTLVLSGFKGFKQLLGAFLRKGARWVWFLVALALQPLITLITLGLERLFSIGTFNFADQHRRHDPISRQCGRLGDVPKGKPEEGHGGVARIF
jgi:uncharacterized membrane protein (DUF485 family)